MKTKTLFILNVIDALLTLYWIESGSGDRRQRHYELFSGAGRGRILNGQDTNGGGDQYHARIPSTVSSSTNRT